MVFSPDGSRLLTASADATLRVWNVATGATETVLHGHEGWVRSGVFVGDGSRVLSGGYDQDLRLWDARTGETTLSMHGHRGLEYEVAASPPGDWAVSVDSNSSLTLWDLKSGEEVHSFSTPWRPRNTTVCGDMSPDGNYAAAGDTTTVYVWDLRPARTAWIRRGKPSGSDPAAEVAP